MKYERIVGDISFPVIRPLDATIFSNRFLVSQVLIHVCTWIVIARLPQLFTGTYNFVLPRLGKAVRDA